MKTYTIKKGQHKATPRRPKFWLGKKQWTFKFVLTESCWYPEGTIAIEGISKVCGLSFGIHAEDPFGKCKLTKWLVNSLVMGWRPNYEKKNYFELYVINDDRGKETRPLLTRSWAANKECVVKVIKQKNGVTFKIGEVGHFYPMNTLPFGYYLGFYHGGKCTAPQDMDAELTHMAS